MRESTPKNAAAARTIGLVLAAGASSRMGEPKALLPLPDGRPLAAAQAARLRAAGCAETVIVLGAQAGELRAALAGDSVAVNPDWAAGRCTSVQAGLRARPDAAGYVILPVDNVLVRTATLRELLAAVRPEDRAVRPWHGGAPGRVVWLGAEQALRVLDAPPAGRLDDLLRPVERRLPMRDPGVTSDINTPAGWQAARATLAEWAGCW